MAGCVILTNSVSSWCANPAGSGGIWLKLAPHLARPLPFFLPIYHGDPYSPLKIRLGLSIYDVLGNLGGADHHRTFGRAEALRLVRGLRSEGLRGGALYYDSQTDDARLVLEMVLAAAERGASVANYAEVRALRVSAAGPSRQVVSAEVEDRHTDRCHEVAARFWVNATGPWVDRLRALVPDFDGSITVRLTKGTHLIVPAVHPHLALFAAISPGSRVFLLIPFHGYTLLGTTDTDFSGDPSDVRPDRADSDYLLGAANRVLLQPLTVGDVVGSFAGVRALSIEPGRSPSENSREYRIHQEPGIQNFVSICGGKLTTARALAEKLVERIATRLGAPLRNAEVSRTTPLPGGKTGPFQEFVRKAVDQAGRDFGIAAPTAERIARTYGSRWSQVLEPLRETAALAEPLAGNPSLLAAEVHFAIRQEMAANVEDFLVRRSGLNWLAACTMRDAPPAVAGFLGRELGWGRERREESLNSFAACGNLPASG